MDSSEALARGLYAIFTEYPCYEVLPQNAAFPYILLGEESIVRSDTKTFDRKKHVVTIHIFDKGTSSLKSKQVCSYAQSRIEQALQVTGYRIDLLRLALVDSKKENVLDGVVFHSIIEYEITLIKE